MMLRQIWNKLVKSHKNVGNLDPSLYKWEYIELDNVGKFPDAIHDIYSRKIDGIIIRNVFSPSEVKLMRTRIESMDQRKMYPTNEGTGHAYPRVFSQVARPDNNEEVTAEYLNAYFEECDKLPSEILSLLGVDFIARLEEVLTQLSGGRKIDVPKGINGVGKYAATTIRMNHPGKGFISVHCGNYFSQVFKSFYSHLRTEVNVTDQLSYFVTVNPAQIGGELTLYDLIWKSGQTSSRADADEEVIISDGSSFYTGEKSPLKRMQVKPGAGDLLIFPGGPIWHRVELVKGKEERITIGGFLSFTEDMKTVKYWS
jgi:hypothetical protein